MFACVATGGGALFETETILGVAAGHEVGDDTDSFNAHAPARGLAREFWIFHTGSWTSAIREKRPRYVTLDNVTCSVTGEYLSLDEWYVATLRAEFAERYGLVPL